MRQNILLYLKSCRMMMRCQMQYRASFWMSTFSQFVMLGTEFLGVVLLLDRFTTLGQWNAGEIFFFFGHISMAFYICEAFCRGITSFSHMVGNGALDTLLVRPRGVLFQVLCSQADPRRFGCIAVSLAALLLGCMQAHVQWTLVKVLLLIWSIAASVALITGLFLIEATFSFFSVKSIEMVNVLTYGGRSACQYPVDIYPSWLRMLFSVIAPFALTAQLPAAYILGKPLWHTGAAAAFLAPLAGYAFLAVMIAVFYRGLRHYRSTGS